MEYNFVKIVSVCFIEFGLKKITSSKKLKVGFEPETYRKKPYVFTKVFIYMLYHQSLTSDLTLSRT